MCKTYISLEGLVRTIKSHVESEYGFKLQGQSRVLSWLIRHCGWLISRFQKKADGATAFEKSRGKKYEGEVLPFAEIVQYREHGDHLNKLQNKWHDGV